MADTDGWVTWEEAAVLLGLKDKGAVAELAISNRDHLTRSRLMFDVCAGPDKSYPPSIPFGINGNRADR